MLRRTPASLISIPYSTVIVGAGNAGCYLAHTLAMAGQRVAVVEAGSDIRTKPRWHYEVPAAQLAHRVQKSGYEEAVTTTPQQDYKGNAVGPMQVPYPKVLGGSGVMGGKAWVHGGADDWADLPFDFKQDVRAAYQQLEGIENPLPYRGKHGKFFVSRPATTSPCYKPFSESLIEKKVPYIINFNLESGVMPAGVGRPEVLVDKRAHLGHSTLRSFMLEAITLKRDVTLLTNTKATALVGKGGHVHGVAVVGKDGKETVLDTRRVILAGNAVNNAQLVLRSEDFAAQSAAVPIGQNFYDKPSVVLQYASVMNDTHQMFDTVLTRALALADWQWRGAGNAVTSAYDDMVCYWSPDGPTASPSVKIAFQPFAVDNTGAFNTSASHAVQFVIELLRPASRGVVTADAVDPNYYSDAADKELMTKAVAFVQSLATGLPMRPVLGSATSPIAELHQGTGISGGTFALDTVTEAPTMAVKGFEGLYVCDGSVLPRPMVGSPIATTLATSTLCTNALLDGVGAKVVEEATKDAPNHHPGTVGGQDDRSSERYSNTVKVTYY